MQSPQRNLSVYKSIYGKTCISGQWGKMVLVLIVWNTIIIRIVSQNAKSIPYEYKCGNILMWKMKAWDWITEEVNFSICFCQRVLWLNYEPNSYFLSYFPEELTMTLRKQQIKKTLIAVERLEDHTPQVPFPALDRGLNTHQPHPRSCTLCLLSCTYPPLNLPHKTLDVHPAGGEVGC